MKLRNLFSAKDMTVGAPWQRIAEFAVPMLLGNIAQQLYNTVDSIVVGKYVGDNALAAVGSSSPILNLLLALFVGISTGAGIIISQRFGANDREGLSRAIGNCISLAAIASLIILVVGPLISRPMLELLDTPDSIIDWCTSYLNIFFIGGAGFMEYYVQRRGNEAVFAYSVMSACLVAVIGLTLLVRQLAVTRERMLYAE